MRILGPITFLYLLLGSIGAAEAQTACQTIDQFFHSAAIVKQIEAAPSGQPSLRAGKDLETLANRMALPRLIDPKSLSSFPSEAALLRQYLSNIREAAASAQAGYEDYTKDVLASAIPPEFTKTLLTLEAHWNCGAAVTAPVSLDLKDPDIETARYYGGALSDSVTEKAQLHSRARGTLKTARRFSGGGSNLPVSQLDTVIPAASIKLFLLLSVLGLLIGVFYARSRSTKRVIREQRRLITLPVKIDLGAAVHTLTMVDISRSGFKVRHPEVIGKQGPVQVQLGGHWYLGQIQWHNKLFAGVRFKKPIDTEVFKAVVQASVQP